MLRKDLLKLNLQSSKIYLAGDLPCPYRLWNDLSKSQISVCLFPAENHLKGPLSPNAEKIKIFMGWIFFPLKLKLVLPKPMYALYILPKVDYLLYWTEDCHWERWKLQFTHRKLIPGYFWRAAFSSFNLKLNHWVRYLELVPYGILITDLQDKSTDFSAWYTRPWKSGLLLFGIISRQAPVYVTSQQFCTIAFSGAHCTCSCSGASLQVLPSLECPLLTFFCLEKMYSCLKTYWSYHHFG